MTERTGGHMSPEAFRELGYKTIDWLVDYFSRIEEYPVLSRAEPGQIRAALPNRPPEQGEDFEAMLKDMSEIILPGLTHWQSPNFFAFFPANSSGPSVLGELLAAGLGVQGMLWTTSPACTELESHVLDWLADMLGLPATFQSDGPGGGVIQDSASSAVLCALIAARERASGSGASRSGTAGLPITAYTSTQAHSSVEKAMGIAGLGRDNLRLIETDSTYAMRPDRLAECLERDRQRGFRPAFVCATLGTTAANGIDPVPEIGDMCRRYGLWLHVDAAMAGTAALCPEFRFLHQGLEEVDSYCFNPHKWMFTNFDCDCFWVADRDALTSALTILPDYLRNRASESGAVVDYRDWQIPLGRRFRALKLWFVIRYYGLEGLRQHIRRHVELARQFAAWVEDSSEFELAVQPPLNLVCFRHIDGDERNRQLLERLNRSGRIYLTQARLDGRVTLRLCVGQTWTEAVHVEQAWQLIQDTADELAG
jgi:aromatic-L-amino-acid decarboxylase